VLVANGLSNPPTFSSRQTAEFLSRNRRTAARH
jgi:hypothetical protein